MRHNKYIDPWESPGLLSESASPETLEKVLKHFKIPIWVVEETIKVVTNPKAKRTKKQKKALEFWKNRAKK